MIIKKRSTTLLLVLSILALTAVVVYAVVNFTSTQTYTTSFTKKEYFKLGTEELITNTNEIGIGESVTISPVLTSDASVDMYVFIRVEMPVYNDDGLYDLDVNDTWKLVESGLVESGAVDGKWVEVYQYNEVLGLLQSTNALSNTMTMVNMSKADFAQLNDIDVSMTGYAYKVSDNVSAEEAWEFIKSEAGL